MSDDIVKELRESKIALHSTAHKAADEIEKMREELDACDEKTKELCDEITCSHADLAAVTAERDRMREALLDTTASLVASVSLLERGGKKAAPSDTMFAQMLVDYKNSIDRARAALEGVTEPATPWSDIESAPRDGTKFLAWFTWPGRHSVEMARWQSNQSAKQPKPYWTCDNERLHGIIATRAAQPTHWMPLPEPPK